MPVGRVSSIVPAVMVAMITYLCCGDRSETARSWSHTEMYSIATLDSTVVMHQ